MTDSSTFSGATVTYDSGAATIVLEQPSTQVGTTGTITIQPYSAPLATAQSVTANYGTAQNITLTGTDSNNATLTFAIASQPAHGTLSGTAPNLTYTPASSYFGVDSFTFTVNDGVSNSTAEQFHHGETAGADSRQSQRIGQLSDRDRSHAHRDRPGRHHVCSEDSADERHTHRHRA